MIFKPAFFVFWVAASVAIAQTNFKQTYYFRTFGVEGDSSFERAGFEYENRALPGAKIDFDQHRAAFAAFQGLHNGAAGLFRSWEQLGPINPIVPGPVTYTGRPTADSGRATAVLISPQCNPKNCPIFLGAAGGGIWKADNALALELNWRFVNSGIPTNAIGSLAFDPIDKTGRTFYAGTGEANGSSDSEAGLGVYKSIDGGETWFLLPGSLKVAHDRSVAGIAVDPVNPLHLYIGTAVARHGSSAVNGGRFTPPNAPPLGLYESWNGGLSFSLIFSLPSDPVDPSTPNGNDFFRGGISKIVIDRTGLAKDDPSRLYVSVFDYGLYRSTPENKFEQIFLSAGSGSPGPNSGSSRTEFALTPIGTKIRNYLADAGSGPADFYRTDDGTAPAGALLSGGINNGWQKLSNSTPGTVGFSSYNFCGQQCSYDMFVASPPGHPDTVWLGGQINYDEIFTANPPSNGRAVLRSINAGVSFTDMTNDTQNPPLGMHPDQHAIGFTPFNPDIAFVASDGGVVRTSGQFSDQSAQCSTRGLTGTDLTDCTAWLAADPSQLYSLNSGLPTLQFQSVSFAPNSGLGELLGGTQDNGTWSFDGNGNWFESVGGDGGSSGFNPGQLNTRMHTYTDAVIDVNFNGSQPLGWDFIGDPLLQSKESASFYIPLISDTSVAGTWFAGLQHVWRTQDNGGAQSELDAHCNEFTGDFTITCGDWVPLGGGAGSGNPGDLTSSHYGGDKTGSYVVALSRAANDSSTLWAATRLGRLFIAKNGDASASSVLFNRIDTLAQPGRFISGVAVDPANANRAFISFSGYNAYTPHTPGHVFEVRYNPDTNRADWTDLSANLGDQPITGIAFDQTTGQLFVATDFGVLTRPSGLPLWLPSGLKLPLVAVYALALDPSTHVLYAATHGRGIWRLNL